jgi:hypothetical protein
MNNKSTKPLAILALMAAMLLPASAANAVEPTAKPKPAIELGTPFADDAILQREMKVPVWGWSESGTKVSVQFAGQKKSAVAGNDGKWMLELDPLSASAEPAEMVVTEGTGATRTLKNILVGEVWVASGQSNMQWNASKCDVGRVLMKGIAERVAAGEEKEPVIREALVTNYFACLHPIEHAEGQWSNAGDNSSAIAYAFAYKLHKELGVPIGILNCSFSQTAIQAWTPRCGFAGGKDEYTQAIYQRILQTDPSTPEHKVAWSKFYHDIENTLKENEERTKNGESAKAIPTKTPGNLSGNRDASWLFNARMNPMIPFAVRGCIWNQGYANMGEGFPYYNNLHSMIRGWRTLWNRPELPVYFHQFYCPGGSEFDKPSIGSASEMRLGTWLARDIPNSGMASQIDITGAIHYTNKTLPGQRLALHALKNQYGKQIVADGPMFKSYTVEGNKLVVSFEHAKGGLFVAETGTDSRNGLANPTIIEGGDDQVKLFFLADENRVWHPANAKIDGDKVIVTSAKVKSPRGVSYGTGGIGFQPNIYNRALLPTTPFIYYDNRLVTSRTWPDEKLKIAGEVIDPNTVGKLNEWRKMPILSTQFRDNAVLQAGQPITFWGSVMHDYGVEAEGEAVIMFSFAGIEKTILVSPNPGPSIFEIGPGQSRFSSTQKEWRVTVPPMEASAEPKTLKVTFTIDGEVAHERICTNIVVGDVWFVAASQMKLTLPIVKQSSGIVRVMNRKAKRSANPRPSRYSICVSRTPENRFASEWTDADGGLAQFLGQRIQVQTGKPVGIIYMQNAVEKGGANPELKSWVATEDLKQAPSLMADYKDLASVLPGNQYYDANAMNYIAAWKQHWRQYVPRMMATKAVPDGAPWGSYPTVASSVTSEASQTYNIMVHSFTPGSFKGVIFLTSPQVFSQDEGAHFGEQLTALANGWKDRFGGEDPHFFYTVPSKALVPKLSLPQSIKGKSTAIEIDNWSEISTALEAAVNKAYGN